MLTVCLVDDEPLLLSGMQRVLRRAVPPMSVTLAGSGPEALDVLSRQAIDVLISDLRMPGMDGAALLERVQRLYPHTARVLSTGALDAVGSFELQLVAHRAVAKPMNSATLIALIQEFGENNEPYAATADDAAREIPWAVEAARRLQEQAAPAITAEVAGSNPALAMLLMQATHGGFSGDGKPLDLHAALHQIGPLHLETIHTRLLAMRPGDDSLHVAALWSAASCALRAETVQLSREIAEFLWLGSSQNCDASESETLADFVSVAETAAVLRWAARPFLRSDVSDRDVAMRSAREAARLGVCAGIVQAIRESVDSAPRAAITSGAAVGWAVALLHDPDVLHSNETRGGQSYQRMLSDRDRWRERARSSSMASQSVA